VRQKPRRPYPIARPAAAPPPDSPYHERGLALMQPSSPPPVPVPVFPSVPFPGRAAQPAGSNRTLAVMALIAGVVFVSMTAGWYFIQGPGSRAMKDVAGKQEKETEKEAAPGPVAQVEQPRNRPKEDPVVPPRTEPKQTPRPTDTAVNRNPPPQVDPPPMPRPPDKPKGPAVTFEEHILPIFEAKCINCHGLEKKRGSLDVRTVALLLKGGDMGPSIVPGKPDQSNLVESILSNKMPPPGASRKLTQKEKDLIEEWIKLGAPDAKNTVKLATR
jgi:hypothetical protein